MAETKTIPSTNASFPEYLDFQTLRKKGIEHCQSLGSDLWTDFNLHDPGLSILEVLCYALTDLGYRTNLPIADLLARSPEQKARDQADGSNGKPFDDNFFTAEQILTCNPVTLLDLRKLVIDVPGVRNAWIEQADSTETEIYLNDKTAELQYEVPEHLPKDDPGRIAAAKLTPDGLYVVYLELDDTVASDVDGAESVPVDRILGDVWKLLHRHRNLCEDFLDVVILGDEFVALCADVEIDASANPPEVLLAMYRQLDELLSPTINFYSLQEMLGRGKRIEEIYAGRPLTPLAELIKDCPGACSHGFIDEEELQQSKPRSKLHASDLYQVIMDVPGVLAVRDLMMVNYVNDRAQTCGEKWCLHLTPMHRQRFDLQRSKFVFYKEQFPLVIGDALKNAAERSLHEERNGGAKAPLESNQLDRAVPEGEYRQELGSYRAIVHEFPLVYGIGDGGIPESAPATRKAQVHQLRAYLLFYDQIMANYLAQLANLRELFSVRPDNRRGAENNRTYFTQRLSDVPGFGIPGIRDLLRNYNGGNAEKNGPPVPDDYPDYLDFMVEDSEEYASRRNDFLDHLLARFAESFTDYVMLMFDVNGQQHDNQRILHDKTEFLGSYPETSRNRGKGFDYSNRAYWNTDNVSGLENRLRRLLGIKPRRKNQDTTEQVSEHYSRGTLGHAEVVKVEGGWYWSVELAAVGDGDSVMLMSRHSHASEVDAREALDSFRILARDEQNYRRLAYSKFRHFGFGVLEPANEDGNTGERQILAEFPWLFPPDEMGKATARDEMMVKIEAFFDSNSPDVETEIEGKLHFFVVATDIADAEKVIFRSHRGYSSAEKAQEAATVFIAQAARSSEHKKFWRGGFVHYGFAVVGDDGIVLTEVERPWPTPQPRDIYLAQLLQTAIRDAMIALAEDETPLPFKLVETAPSYRCRLAGPQGVPFLESEEAQIVGRARADGFNSHEGRDEALQDSAASFKDIPQPGSHIDCSRFVELAQDNDNFRQVTSAEWCQHGFELLGEDGQTLARHPRLFATAEARDEYVQALQCLADTEGLHLVEHILLRPKNGFIEDVQAESEQQQEKLLPVGDGCRDANGKLCPVRADQYSFRATVVVPYWPRRFRATEFRRFFERTIRMETPAHVFLRICWVDVCQMRAFEDAYRQWLCALSHPSAECDRTAAHNALVDILFQLKSVYPTARLPGDEVTQPVILGQTILGTGAENDVNS